MIKNQVLGFVNKFEILEKETLDSSANHFFSPPLAASIFAKRVKCRYHLTVKVSVLIGTVLFWSVPVPSPTYRMRQFV